MTLVNGDGCSITRLLRVPSGLLKPARTILLAADGFPSAEMPELARE
jgi:hypothetical protein